MHLLFCVCVGQKMIHNAWHSWHMHCAWQFESTQEPKMPFKEKRVHETADEVATLQREPIKNVVHVL
jgi:hypothetical protein